MVAGCGLFSGQPSPTPGPTATPRPTATPTARITPTPAPTPQLVKAITLVANIGEPADSTPAGLTWLGIQAAATRIGATATLVQPPTIATLAREIEKAATASPDGAVVVTIGTDGMTGVLASAAAHPTTQFLEMGVVVADGAPANVHGVVFDEAEEGYLAGYIAASYAADGKVGMVGDTATDSSSANYAAGFSAGAKEARADAVATIGYAGSRDAPEKGRTAAAKLIASGNTVLLTLPSLAGIGAMRETAAQDARFVAVGTDAWTIVPDAQAGMIAAVIERYDTAVGLALDALAGGKAVPRIVMNATANGGIAVGERHVPAPAGFESGLATVVAALRHRSAG
jgi:basic membrane protein A